MTLEEAVKTTKPFRRPNWTPGYRSQETTLFLSREDILATDYEVANRPLDEIIAINSQIKIKQRALLKLEESSANLSYRGQQELWTDRNALNREVAGLAFLLVNHIERIWRCEGRESEDSLR